MGSVPTTATTSLPDLGFGCGEGGVAAVFVWFDFAKEVVLLLRLRGDQGKFCY